MTHHEIEDLLGAYALNAVEPDEAALVEAHLAECPRCRAEVAEHREVAALLTSGVSEPTPDGVWDRIAADLGDTPPPIPIEVAFGQREAERTAPVVADRSRPRGVLTGLAAAAVVVVIALMGAVLVNQRQELDDLQTEVATARSDAELAALLSNPATRVVSLQGDENAGTARALVGHDGDSVLLGGDLPDLGPGQTYQLWGLPEGRDTMVSLGVLGASPDNSPFHLEGPVNALAISREPGGGSTEPTTEPVVSGPLV